MCQVAEASVRLEDAIKPQRLQHSILYRVSWPATSTYIINNSREGSRSIFS
jgi:hypothetical protein